MPFYTEVKVSCSSIPHPPYFSVLTISDTYPLHRQIIFLLWLLFSGTIVSSAASSSKSQPTHSSSSQSPRDPQSYIDFLFIQHSRLTLHGSRFSFERSPTSHQSALFASISCGRKQPRCAMPRDCMHTLYLSKLSRWLRMLRSRRWGRGTVG